MDYPLLDETALTRSECEGRKITTLSYVYLGADDTAGPNYTGQPAVNSHYRRTCS